MEVIWSELPDGLTKSILKWLPLEAVARFRTVSKEWNSHLSAQKFLTWRRKNLKEDLWLLLHMGTFYYRLNVRTKVLKVFSRNSPCFSWASLGGLLFTVQHILKNPLNGTGIEIPLPDTAPRERIVVCNPEREAFVQLPMRKFNKDQGIIVGDILWKGYQYQVIALCMTFIEVYDFSKKSWVVVQKLPPRVFGDVVFFKGLFLYIVKSSSEWGTRVFMITEDCTCQMVHLFSPIPNTSHLSVPPQLLVCGSTLVVVWQDSKELCMWELKYDSNFKITSKASWKAIPKMPQELLGFLNSDSGSEQCTYKWLAAGEYICICRERSGNLVFFNTENRSWSCFSLRDQVENSIECSGNLVFFNTENRSWNCFSVRDQVENIRARGSIVSAYVFEPRPDISFH